MSQNHVDPKRIYLAGSFSRCDELNIYARELRKMGYVIDCRWLQGLHQARPGAAFVESSSDIPDEAADFAIDDVKDISFSDIVISFTGGLGTTKRGGRHVEFGIAVAWAKRKIIVGPRENVFHCLPGVEHYSTWEQCRKVLEVNHESR